MTYLVSEDGTINTRRPPDKIEVVNLPTGIEITEPQRINNGWLTQKQVKRALAAFPARVFTETPKHKAR